MIKLEQEKYEAILPLLPKEGMNTLFAQSVLRGMVKGEVFTDHQEQPSYFYIRHPYFMTLLVGDPDRADADLRAYLLNERNTRKDVEWMQVYPPVWNAALGELLVSKMMSKGVDEQYRKPLPPEEAAKVLVYCRSDFHFCREHFEEFKSRRKSEGERILMTDEATYYRLDSGVVPQFFWESYEDFITHGMGFTAYTSEGSPASTAFAAYVIDNKFEIGIETREEFRGQGYAESVCAHLIEYCLERDYEPIWGCYTGNAGSRSLALKLGFEEVERRPYYRLPV